MEPECTDIERNTSLGVEVGSSSQPARAYIHFVNRTSVPLWFPAQQEPAFRPDEQAKILTIWFGYFDEVFAQYSGDYVIPTMRLVLPGGNLRIEITSPALVQKVVEQGLLAQICARIATKEIAVSRTRGEQPLQEYMKHSCVIRSRVAVRRQAK